MRLDLPRFEDRALQRFAQQVYDLLRALSDTVPWLAGRRLELGPLGAAGTVRVVHGLGRRPRGFVADAMTRAAGSTTSISVYYRVGAVWDETAIELYATGGYEALGVWVF